MGTGVRVGVGKGLGHGRGVEIYAWVAVSGRGSSCLGIRRV